MLTLPENISCGFFDCSIFGDLAVSPERITTKYEIEFYFEDGKTTTTDNRTYHIKKNYIQIAKPNQTRHSSLPFRTIYLKFHASGEIAEELDKATGFFCSSHPRSVYDKMEELILLNESDNTLLLHSKILSLLDLILKDAKIPSARNGKSSQIVSDAKRFIEANFAKPIKLSDVADSVHLSHIHFHNVFTDSTGITPHQYIIDCRIDKAKKLLWDTDIPICVVAEECGFGCQQYLNKIFKKETGSTPAAYRKTCQQNYIL